jgi:hypothetical protein
MDKRCGPAHPARSPSSSTVSDGLDEQNRTPHLAGNSNRIPDSNDANQIS